MGDSSERIENKIDTVNESILALNISIVKLCEQMRSSTEAVGRAHDRIDKLGSKVEELRDLPMRIKYLEKQIEAISVATAGNSDRVSRREAIGATLTRFSPWLVLGAGVTVLAVLGGLKRAFVG